MERSPAELLLLRVQQDPQRLARALVVGDAVGERRVIAPMPAAPAAERPVQPREK
jgi:hypothetical protein